VKSGAKSEKPETKTADGGERAGVHAELVSWSLTQAERPGQAAATACRTGLDIMAVPVYDSRVNQSRRSLLALAAGASIVSFTGPIVRVLSVAPTVTAFYRMVFGGAILLAIVLVARQRLRLDRVSLLLAAGAAMSFAVDMTMWNRSMVRCQDIGNRLLSGHR